MIKNFFINLWNWAKARKILSSIITIVVIIVGWYFISTGSQKPTYNIAIAKRGTVIQEVSVTGRVKPTESVELAFEKGGRVIQVLADVDDRVYGGQVLVKLDDSELSSQLSKAEADLQTQKANLNEAEIVLNNYYGNIPDVINDAYTKANDAIRRQTDNFFSDDEKNPALTFLVSNFQIENDVEFQRLIMGRELDKWQSELSQSNEQVLDIAQGRLNKIQTFLDRLMEAIINSMGLNQTTVDTYKANLNTARTNIVAATTSVTNQKQNISSQKAVIATSQASIKAFQATIQNIKAQLAKTALYSPINGIITKQDTKVGELVAANTIMVSIISSAKFEIEAFIPEADIAKIKIGNAAKVTLDAYGNDVIFEVKVIKIDPAETLIEGVATYKTTFQFIKESELIKSGMTANLDILTDKKDNVIYIPQRAIKTNNEKTVRILNKNGNAEEIIVETGLKGSDGNIEIINGINEGEQIITSEQQQ